jgi:translation initiation factor IF-1
MKFDPVRTHKEAGAARGNNGRTPTLFAVYLPIVDFRAPWRVLNTPQSKYWGQMSKEDSIEVTGTVVEKFPAGLFSVQLDQDRTVLAHLAGKLRRNRIRVLAGDRVTVEMSPYDLTKGRITYRHK